jgi:cobalt-zinc-cadmium efflux system membrane fusion protein
MTKQSFMIGVLGTALAVASCSNPPEQPAKPSQPAAQEHADASAADPGVVQVSDEMMRDLRVTTATVEEHRGGEAASMLGELTVNENAYAEVGAPTQGRIVTLHATLGQTVRTGAPLATIESGELGRARSDAAAAQARLTLAQRTLERRRALNVERIVPLREVQEAENEVAAAEQQLRSAQGSLQALGASRELSGDSATRLTVVAPSSGTVVERSAVLGQVVDPSATLFKIADLSTLWLTVHAFERDAMGVRIGETVRIAFAAMPGRTFSGKVSFIGHTVESDSRTVPIRVDLPNPGTILRPGMSATASLPVGDEAGVMLMVPAAALQRVRNRWCVFVPKTESTFEIRPVGRGRDLAGGLKSGDVVVVDGAFLLKAETEKSAGEHEAH